MRDNPNHGASIMGGMWGAKLNPELRNEFKESFVKIFKDGLAYANREGGGWDQIVLKRFADVFSFRKLYIQGVPRNMTVNNLKCLLPNKLFNTQENLRIFNGSHIKVKLILSNEKKCKKSFISIKV